MKRENFLDKDLLLFLLDEIEKSMYNKDIDSVYLIESQLNKIFKNINKEKLIKNYISLNPEMYKILQVRELNEFYNILPLVLQSGDSFLKETNDTLYLIAQLSILIDNLLYNKINLELC